MPADPWEWGWDALVAIGTLALAVVTVVLAWSTRRMARAAAQDVARNAGVVHHVGREQTHLHRHRLLSDEERHNEASRPVALP
jgi:hypothetical protein